MTDSQERKSSVLLAVWLVHDNKLTSIDNYDDGSQVVDKWGVGQSGYADIFFEEVLHLTGVQALKHTFLMRSCVMSNAGL